MARLRAPKRCRLVAKSLNFFLLSLTYPVISMSARPVGSSAFSMGGSAMRAPRGDLRTSSTPQPRQGQLADSNGLLDLATLRRGDVYAVNLHGATFKLARVDIPAMLRLHNGRLTAASLTSAVRAAQPGENVGWAWFADSYQEDGWYRLELRIDEDAPFPDVVKARAAGFVEGNLQSPHMYRYWTNYRVNEYRGRGEAPSQELYDWFDEQYGWMTRRIEKATGWNLATLRGETPAAQNPTSSYAAAAAAAGDIDGGGAGAGNGGDAAGGGGDGDNDVPGSSERRYWALVGLVAAQFEGLTAGFWASVAEPDRNMTWHELYALNAIGDMYDLNVLFPPSAEPSAPPAAAAAAAASAVGAEPAGGAVRQQRRHYTPGHGEVGEYGYGELLDCSAIIKLDPSSDGGGGDGDDEDGDDGGSSGGLQRFSRNFWASHNTWRAYYDMVRTWKVYDLPWASTGPVTVSSSPGLLHSKDDWYTTDAFVVMETTNGIYNKNLYDKIQPKCVLMWQRVQVANFGAREGSEWVDLFVRHNSGTYNNQWMVLDVDALQLPRPRSDVLWVVEQVPGTTISRDVTKVLLEQGYWASYNVPYFPEIYNLTAYPQPSIYTSCPRARIFSREQSRLTSRSDVMGLMRLNRYREDPLSLGTPNNAIAARYDLPGAPDDSGQPRNWTRRAYGAVDAKVVDLKSFRTRRTYVINGPTADDQPVFRWSTADPAFDAIRREGCVDEFNFGWQAYEAVVGPPEVPQRAAAEAAAI
ncbi:hypothetical protein PLESTB_001243800 [Pleodorina starrii]|uniref:Phospholipase B-like n=1 Tax=Pleodorina starrii TaxID=330485 RepID=A0A9W6BU76_9CHLO|nr:hypothetical protein PLESTM_000216000 [Pleodorina starrii]GLC57591.1 hypothetical protein PLESTB_001243800 [Pleodorina starrii]GLC63261.1 hypothetical protein PLESTF_000017600 [Pleodorina starrii]